VRYYTWPVASKTPRLEPGNLAATGQIAVYSVDPRHAGARKLHAVRLTTGKDVVIATGLGAPLGKHDAALEASGLVYFVNTKQHGRLVLVPTAKLLEMTS
jgi:hypothetical protein